MHGWLGTYSTGLTDTHKEGAEEGSLKGRSPACPVLLIGTLLYSTKQLRYHVNTLSLTAETLIKRSATKAHLDLFCVLRFDQLVNSFCC